MEKAESSAKGITSLFKTLSHPDALKLFNHTSYGIGNSTYAIEELDLTPKKYYARLRELVETGLVRKRDNVYRQTALGRMIYDRFLPAMRKAVDAKDELEFLVGLEGLEMETGVRKRVLEELGITIFADFTKVRLIGDYEALVVEVIDLCDSAEESIILASNYFDSRVMEATLKAADRGMNTRIITGKNGFSSRLQQLRMMLSPDFMKILIGLFSKEIELENFIKIVDITYSFCVVDSYRSVFEFYNPVGEGFIAAFVVEDRKVGETLADLFDQFWKIGESNEALKFLMSMKGG